MNVTTSLLACVLVLGGCGVPVLRYAATETAPNTVLSSATAQTGSSLHIIVSKAIGCVVYKPGSAPGLKCFDLQGSSEDDYKAQVATAASDANVIRSYYIPDYGPALGAALQSRLASHYSAVTVGFAGQDAQAGVVIQSDVGIDDKLISVILHAKLPSGPELIGSSTIVPSHSLAYLAWTIPVTIVLLPTSAFWMPPIIESIRNGQLQDAVPVAIASAATNLASQLVTLAK